MSGSALSLGTYSSALGKAKVAFAVSRGFDEGAILKLLCVTRAELDDPDARLPFAPALAFWSYLVRTLDDPGLPLQFAELTSAADFGVLGFAAMTAPTAADGLRRAVRYYEILADTARLRLAEAGAGTRVELVREGERSLAVRIMNENSVACLLQAIRSATRVDVEPRCVAFRHPAPRDISAHRRFFRAPIQFGAAYDGLVLPPSALARASPMGDTKLGAFLEQKAEALLRRVRSGATLTERVRASIAQGLVDGEPQIARVARRLGASERTLRRHLDAENVTFRRLVDEVRRELAAEYLAGSKANVTEIAYLLGFSEVSAFSRAFKRWYGQSPRAYQRPPPL